MGTENILQYEKTFQKKKIAIIGAGLAGLAVAWHLSSYHTATTPLEITLYDAKGIGAGASGLAAGLLHPYSGRRSSLNWRALDAMAATLQLKDIAEASLQTTCAAPTGLIRLPVDEKQRHDFHRCAESYSDATIRCHSLNNDALFIASAYTFDCKKYLPGLWTACERQGVTLKIEPVSSLSALTPYYDALVAATGASILPELSTEPLSYLKGQILEIAWPASLPPLPCPTMESVYLLPSFDTKEESRCIIGATFEKSYSTPLPDSLGVTLLTKAACLYPQLLNAEILGHRSAIRVSTPQRRPLYKRLSDKWWTATALGSKGLLYHALLGRELAAALYQNL